MALEAKSKAAATGSGGTPPISTIALMENKSTAHTSTKLSTKSENPWMVNERNPHRTDSCSKGKGREIAGLAAAESTSCESTGGKIDTRPEAAAAFSI